MLKLDSKIELNNSAIKASNLCDRFSDDDLTTLGGWVYNGYKRDLGSRSDWERRTEAAMDLALQVQKDKTFPWVNCANIAFPLVTIAILQFHARAYPAIISGTDIVKCRVNGEDASGMKRQRADRISDHMSYQVLEEDQSWEEQHDRLLINVPCVGTAFTKTYYDTSKGHNVSELVLARDLVIDYWAKSVEVCPRKTHRIPGFRNDIHEKILRGTYRDVREESWYDRPAQLVSNVNKPRQDNRQGITQPSTDETTPFMLLEQHVNVDLDDDGYAEPYIITIEENSKTVLRIVTGFDREEDIERVVSGKNKGQIIQVRALQYFTKYGFIPSPDGGIYDIGFGVLLGPLNESVNSIINQLVDSGTMATTAGGFLGRGAKIRGGKYTFSPFEWVRVDSTGEDLQKSMMPLPVREPSMVMLQLLTLIIDYTNRISGAVDITVGENPGQNTPAETSRTMVAQGEKIYSAIYKRTWRSMKEEFKKWYIFNAIYLPITSYYGAGQKALREDYLGPINDICPAADPNLSSDAQNFMQVQALKQAAATTAGYDAEAVERRYLRALKVDGIEEIYPGPKVFPPPGNPKVELENKKIELKQMELRQDQYEFAADLQVTIQKNNAQILLWQAQAAKLMAEIQTDQINAQVNAVNAQIGVLHTHNEMLMARVDRVLKSLELQAQGELNGNQGGAGINAGGGGIPSLAAAPNNAEVPEDAASIA